MIESGVGPSGGVVTLGAERSREAGGDVIGDVSPESLRAGPGRLVAAVAIGICRSEIVIVVDVALSARRGGMSACQGKTSGSVVEGSRIGPGNRVVTGRTVCGSKGGACGGMRGIVGLLPGGEVTARVAAIVWLDA